MTRIIVTVAIVVIAALSAGVWAQQISADLALGFWAGLTAGAYMLVGMLPKWRKWP